MPHICSGVRQDGPLAWTAHRCADYQIASPEGTNTVCKQFPKLRMVCPITLSGTTEEGPTSTPGNEPPRLTSTQSDCVLTTRSLRGSMKASTDTTTLFPVWATLETATSCKLDLPSCLYYTRDSLFVSHIRANELQLDRHSAFKRSMMLCSGDPADETPYPALCIINE
jgi:hypothetical protein